MPVGKVEQRCLWLLKILVCWIEKWVRWKRHYRWVVQILHLFHVMLSAVLGDVTQASAKKLRRPLVSMCLWKQESACILRGLDLRRIYCLLQNVDKSRNTDRCRECLLLQCMCLYKGTGGWLRLMIKKEWNKESGKLWLYVSLLGNRFKHEKSFSLVVMISQWFLQTKSYFGVSCYKGNMHTSRTDATYQ